MDLHQKILIAAQDPTDGIAQDNLRIYNQAYEEFIKQQLKTNMNIAISLRKSTPLGNLIHDNRKELKLQQAKKYGTYYLWLTISPHNKIIFENFKEKIHKTAKSRMFSSAYYVFEQRGQHKDEIGKGFHAHLLLTRNLDYKQSKVIYNLKNSYEKYTDVKNRDIFNYHWLHEEYLQDKIDYITDQNKHGQEKESKQLMDILFRQNKNLKEYYKCPEEETFAKADAENTNQKMFNTETMLNIN